MATTPHTSEAGTAAKAAEARCIEAEIALFWRRVEAHSEPLFLLKFSADPEADLALLAHDYEEVLLSQREINREALRANHELRREKAKLRDENAALRRQSPGRAGSA